jgi:hypothetical protein
MYLKNTLSLNKAFSPKRLILFEFSVVSQLGFLGVVLVILQQQLQPTGPQLYVVDLRLSLSYNDNNIIIIASP